MDDIPIPEIDRERLEGMVAAYRRSIENLYRLAHTQGAIEADNAALKKLRNANPQPSSNMIDPISVGFGMMTGGGE